MLLGACHRVISFLVAGFPPSARLGDVRSNYLAAFQTYSGSFSELNTGKIYKAA